MSQAAAACDVAVCVCFCRFCLFSRCLFFFSAQLILSCLYLPRVSAVPLASLSADLLPLR